MRKGTKLKKVLEVGPVTLASRTLDDGAEETLALVRADAFDVEGATIVHAADRGEYLEVEHTRETAETSERTKVKKVATRAYRSNYDRIFGKEAN